MSMKKKDKRYKNFFDNYRGKVGGTIFMGFVYVVIAIIAYIIYNLLK